MARGKAKFNSTFAIIEQLNASHWAIVSAGHNSTTEAEAALKQHLLGIENPTCRYLIINVKKGFTPKVTVVLNEQGGADFLGVKAGAEEEEETDEEVVAAFPAATLPPVTILPFITPDILLKPDYVEPTGSDPIQLVSESKTPTSDPVSPIVVETGGPSKSSSGLENVVDLAPQPVKSSKPVALSPDMGDPRKW